MRDTNLLDFAPERIKEREKKKAEEQRIMDLLSRFTAGMLMEALRSNHGHPKPEWGDGDTWRSFYLSECSRRGTKLLEQLKWPINKSASYINVHTQDVKTLWDIATTGGVFADKHTIANQVWSVIEHWDPYSQGDP